MLYAFAMSAPCVIMAQSVPILVHTGVKYPIFGRKYSVVSFLPQVRATLARYMHLQALCQ